MIKTNGRQGGASLSHLHARALMITCHMRQVSFAVDIFLPMLSVVLCTFYPENEMQILWFIDNTMGIGG